MLKARKLKDQEQLWHALLFYTVGETVREVLAADGLQYEPYATKNGLFGAKRSWGKFLGPLDEKWKPYLRGNISLDQGIQRLVDTTFSGAVK